MHKRISLAAASVLFAGCASQPSDRLEPIDLTIRQSPAVTIASPAPGSFIQASGDGMVDVTGTARGASIQVNGHATAVDAQGKFHARIPAAEGLNVIDAHLNGLLGGESQRAFLYGSFADADAAIAGGVMVRATARAFDDHAADLNDFSSIARAMLAQVDIMQFVRQLPPFTWDLGPAHVDVAVTDVHFAQDQTALSLSPREGGAHADGGLQALSITLQLTLDIDGLFKARTSGTVSVDTVAFQADLDAAFSAKDAAIVASTETPAIQLGTLEVKTDLNFDAVDKLLTFLANQFKDLIASTVAQQIQANAANHFAMALNQIGLPSTFSLQPYGLPATLSVTDSFDGASFDAKGANISASTNFAGPSAAGPGSLVIGSAPATSFPEATFGVSVALDALNQATSAVWGQDGLVRTVYPGKKYPGFKLDPLVAAPALPPVIKASGDKVQVSLGDIVVSTTLHTFLADFPVEVTASALSDVALDVDPQNGALRMTPTGTPVIWLDVNTLFGVVPDALLAPLSNLLQQLAPMIVEKMVKPIEVPLPKMSLAKLIPGSTASIGLTAPVAVSVDAAAKRVVVSGDLAEYAKP